MEVSEIHATLKSLLQGHHPALVVSKDLATNFEVSGTKEVMQGKKKVDGAYFANIIPILIDVRLYFFSIYTFPDECSLSPKLQKALKGKSCFHIKKLDDELTSEIKDMIAKGVEIYKEKGWV